MKKNVLYKIGPSSINCSSHFMIKLVWIVGTLSLVSVCIQFYGMNSNFCSTDMKVNILIIGSPFVHIYWKLALVNLLQQKHRKEIGQFLLASASCVYEWVSCAIFGEQYLGKVNNWQSRQGGQANNSLFIQESVL